jgi:hypothetical protein
MEQSTGSMGESIDSMPIICETDTDGILCHKEETKMEELETSIQPEAPKYKSINATRIPGAYNSTTVPATAISAQEANQLDDCNSDCIETATTATDVPSTAQSTDIVKNQPQVKSFSKLAALFFKRLSYCVFRLAAKLLNFPLWLTEINCYWFMDRWFGTSWSVHISHLRQRLHNI